MQMMQRSDFDPLGPRFSQNYSGSVLSLRCYPNPLFLIDRIRIRILITRLRNTRGCEWGNSIVWHEIQRLDYCKKPHNIIMIHMIYGEPEDAKIDMEWNVSEFLPDCLWSLENFQKGVVYIVHFDHFLNCIR